MANPMTQIAAVTSMNLRSLPQRFWTSAATVVAVALVTAVLLGFLALANGFQATLSGTGTDDVAIAVREGSSGELNSVLSREQLQLIAEAPGIARGADGQPSVSGELYVVVDGKRRSTGKKGNLPFRGIGPKALETRQNITITAGRMFTPGLAEIVVGKGLVQQFEGFDLGATVHLGKTDWKIVGVFDAGGSAFESELWADIALLQSVYNRGSSVQTVRMKLTSPDALKQVQAYSRKETRLKLDVDSERAFYASQTGGISDLIFYLGWPLAIAMSFGALAGALNTMYASVDSRMREIATLRAIGFGGLPAFCGTMAEALVLAGLGGLVGAVAVYLAFDGLSAATLGGGFTQVVFAIKLSPALVLQGVILALVIGFIGGFFPALRAARAPLLAAFRA
ncbi:MAG: ABC transporter permease [Alphaproteobacteria bacterium]|nr:ABC transporter permease [Alphaproteobacteria bacterium]